jgi:hypothetical protein
MFYVQYLSSQSLPVRSLPPRISVVQKDPPLVTYGPVAGSGKVVWWRSRCRLRVPRLPRPAGSDWLPFSTLLP